MENQGQQSESIGFPSSQSPQAKRGIAKWIIFVVLLLAILGAGVFFLLRSSNEAIDAPTSTPNIRAIETVYTAPHSRNGLDAWVSRNRAPDG